MPTYQHPAETPEYRKARKQLLEAEIELRNQREHVAELRRALPQDTVCEDYELLEGPRNLADTSTEVSPVRLSELFEDPQKPLVLMQFMYGKLQDKVCPMCTLWADGYDGAIRHLTQRVNFAVACAGDLQTFRAHGRSRGWRSLRLVSTGKSNLKRDLGFEVGEGSQLPGVSVFTLGKDGSPRHFYSQGAIMTDDHNRGMDLLSPVWNFFDLTPDGRGDLFPALEYPIK